MAPDDGVVTRVDDLQVGDFVNPGAAVFSLMSTRDIWIEANFRETGLDAYASGSRGGRSHVDAYPDRAFNAHVVSVSPGTGSDFAVLPPKTRPAIGSRSSSVCRYVSSLTKSTRPAAVLGSSVSPFGSIPAVAAPGAIRSRSCARRRRPNECRRRAGHRSRRPSRNRFGALMATYMQAATISLPNAALLYIQGTLSMADDEVGWIFTSYLTASIVTMTMARWLAGRYGRKAVYQISLAIFALGLATRDAYDDPAAIHRRPCRPRWRERHPRSAVDSDPARYTAALAARPHKPGDRRHPGTWPAERSSHRGLAQRISRLALDVLYQPAFAGFIFLAMTLSLPEKQDWADAALRFLRPDDILVGHGRDCK